MAAASRRCGVHPVPGAADFALYLLSPQGQRSLQSLGFIPVALPQ